MIKLLKKYLFKKKDNKLYADWFSIIAREYWFNIVNWEIKNVYVWKKSQWLMVFKNLLTLDEMKKFLD